MHGSTDMNVLRAIVLWIMHGSTDMNVLRAIVLWIMHGSTDMNALRAMVSRRERISIEKQHIPSPLSVGHEQATI
jgi:uncharacterized membrane protein YwaF